MNFSKFFVVMKKKKDKIYSVFPKKKKKVRYMYGGYKYMDILAPN